MAIDRKAVFLWRLNSGSGAPVTTGAPARTCLDAPRAPRPFDIVVGAFWRWFYPGTGEDLHHRAHRLPERAGKLRGLGVELEPLHQGIPRVQPPLHLRLHPCHLKVPNDLRENLIPLIQDLLMTLGAEHCLTHQGWPRRHLDSFTAAHSELRS